MLIISLILIFLKVNAQDLIVDPDAPRWSYGLGLGPNITELDAVGDRLKSSVGGAIWGSRTWGERHRFDVSFDYFSFAGNNRNYPALSAGYGWRFFKNSRWTPFLLGGAGVGSANNFPLSTEKNVSTVHLFGRLGVDNLYKKNNWSLGLVADFFYVDMDCKPIENAQLALPMLTLSWNGNETKSQVKKQLLVDSDDDGVSDHLDQCPDTPSRVKVNSIGCHKGKKVMKSLKVEFETNRAVVLADYMKIVDEFGQFLKNNPDIKASIEGHTDSVGRDEYNLMLSTARANEVKKLLIQRWKIDPSRLSSVGYGETVPLATNETAEGRSQNRRVIAVLE